MENKLRIGTCNVRILLRSVALKDLSDELRKYNGKDVACYEVRKTRLTFTIIANRIVMSSDAALQ